MSRLMSVAYTADAVIECRKVMGRKPGEPIERLAEVEVLDVRRELLGSIQVTRARAAAELAAEGFPILNGEDSLYAASVYLRRYFYEAQRMTPLDEITRIKWRYVCGSGFCECGGCVL